MAQMGLKKVDICYNTIVIGGFSEHPFIGDGSFLG